MITKQGQQLLADMVKFYADEYGGPPKSWTASMRAAITDIEEEAARLERERIAAKIRQEADDLDSDWDTTYSAEKGISPDRVLAWLEGEQ